MLLYKQFDAGSQKLLDNAERYALYLAEALDDDDRQRRVWQTNNMGEILNFSFCNNCRIRECTKLISILLLVLMSAH